MMGAAVVSGGAALLGALGQGYLNRLNAEDQIQAQDDRRVGEYYLEMKVEALIEYHSNLEKFVAEIRIYKNRAYGDELTKDEWVEEVASMYNSHHHSLTRAAVFLSEEQHEVIDETLGPFKDAAQHVEESISEEALRLIMNDDDWNYAEVIGTFQKARSVVKTEIRAGLERLESQHD